ncbi:MAG TPA: LysM peptidoglycan-binding domain-containing protein [Anaerolineae bacterium]|nr:LysM peptidoglycan-binding domain-containing protein [Anaerolineae bacterium]HQI85960.1 LysM peptidoglycan-binding domain-containing protein [Anaerolineae bacterium]
MGKMMSGSEIEPELLARKDAKPVKPAPAEKAPQKYVVAAGDTLSAIAKKVYGDPDRWKEIFEANKATIKDPNAIRVGQELVIP